MINKYLSTTEDVYDTRSLDVVGEMYFRGIIILLLLLYYIYRYSIVVVVVVMRNNSININIPNNDIIVASGVLS